MKGIFKMVAVLLACLPLLGPIHTAGAGEVMAGVTANWVEKAQRDAEDGNADAQFKLGVMYYEGDGVPQDFAEARRWFEKAAAQGNAEAQYNLGVMHENGQGGPQDKRAAKEWFRKACDGGDQDGCGKYRELNEAGF